MPIKNRIEKVMAVVCMAGVISITNMPIVYAYEAHVMNVVANIIDDSVNILPSGNNFCNDGNFKIELKSSLAGSGIYYTLDGTDPVCGKNGVLYSSPFALTSSKTVKAVSCHNGIQGLPMSKSYTVSYDYCDHTSIKINKVYYNTDSKHSASSCPLDNEWVELYNPTGAAVSIKGWKICDAQGCDVLGNFSIVAKGYAILSVKESTWQFWNIPSSTVKIALGNAIGKDGFSNTDDMVALKDSAGNLIDQANWGTPSTSWANYNSSLWNPGSKAIAQGKIFGRTSNGVDTDKLSDWTTYSLPDVTVTYPNGGEKLSVGSTYALRWNASNNKSSLTVDLYFSNDGGSTWGIIAKGVSNAGSYSWKIPSKITSVASGADYTVVSAKARIKVVATDYSKNFMLSDWDISDKDFCTASCGSITSLTGIMATGAESTSSSSQDSGTDAVKSSEMKSEDGEDYLLNDGIPEKGKDKSDDGSDLTSAAMASGSVPTNTITPASSSITAEEKAGSNAVNNPEMAMADDKSDTFGSSQAGAAGVQSVQTDKGTDSSAASISADKDATTLEFNLNA